MLHDILSDTIARIQNSLQRGYSEVIVKNSNICQRVLDVLLDEGYIRGYKIESKNLLRIYLKYENSVPTIKNIIRISKPSRRIYLKSSELKSYESGLGVFILSTSKGVISGFKAKKLNAGGELLCKVL